MTVYPLVFNIGPIEVTGYGLMMMAGFLMAGWVIQRELRERGLGEAYAADVVVAAVIGGIVGAKVWYAVLYRDAGALLSRGGLVWYGGFIGGFVAVVATGWWRKVPTRLTFELCAPALAVGYALGRVGCFLVQDDYGLPTDVPWAMRFPQGLPPTTAFNLSNTFGVAMPEGALPTEVLAVHPTQLYEVAAMMGIFWLLWRLRRHRHATVWLFGLYLVLTGTERFLVEFLRAKDDRILGALTISQLTATIVVLVGAAILARYWRPDDLRIPKESTVLQPG